MMAVKRLVDIAVASVALVVLAPVLAAVGLAVWMTMGSPVLFRQERTGHLGRPFTLLKFRTMTDARDARGTVLPDEQRLTPLGRLLRASTLDELPEFINVLRGEMSLVGPRPLLPEYGPLYTAGQRRRHEMRPGMAGPVLAWGRNALGWPEKLALDVWYVEHWSLWLDVKILLRTVVTVLRREGVSAQGHATMPKFEGVRGDRQHPRSAP